MKETTYKIRTVSKVNQGQHTRLRKKQLHHSDHCFHSATPAACRMALNIIAHYNLGLHSRGGAPPGAYGVNSLMHDFNMTWWCCCFLNHESKFAYRLPSLHIFLLFSRQFNVIFCRFQNNRLGVCLI